jgi:hypothetical protein
MIRRFAAIVGGLDIVELGLFLGDTACTVGEAGRISCGQARDRIL